MSKLLSICIPTYGRVEILKKTIESILNSQVSPELYEICISDNSPTDETKEMLESCFLNKKNIVYKKTVCEGFYNSIEALKLGSGCFLKLHNNYTMVNDKFVDFCKVIDNYKGVDSLIFFTFGNLKLKDSVMECVSFDQFLYNVNYLSTWSTSFGIWKSDFDELISKIQFDKMFPHTSLLFGLTNKSKYVVDDSEYFLNQTLSKKGGYNLPETFGIRFLGMCDKLLNEGFITYTTYKLLKRKIFVFIGDWFFKTKCYPQKYSFSFENWEKIIYSLYGGAAVKRFILGYWTKCVKKWVKSLVKKNGAIG